MTSKRGFSIRADRYVHCTWHPPQFHTHHGTMGYIISHKLETSSVLVMPSAPNCWTGLAMYCPVPTILRPPPLNLSRKTFHLSQQEFNVNLKIQITNLHILPQQ